MLLLRLLDDEVSLEEYMPDKDMLELLLLIMGLWRLSKISSLMLLPYLVWVTAAGFLNAATVELNGPFA